MPPTEETIRIQQVQCPSCGAEKGEECRTGSGYVRPPHSPRRILAGLGKCPTCNAGPGEACRTANGEIAATAHFYRVHPEGGRRARRGMIRS